ncbi:hypothetical protein [Vibrio sp. F74]|uniref:hypothetical protein n=1 Tax=Vibrio sp. F74 TaxID=700020 RepID=UPI0035F53C81
MYKWMSVFALLSATLHSPVGFSASIYNTPDDVLLEHRNIVCESIVCKSITEPKTVPAVGDVPKRKQNETLEAVSSALYIVGSMGLADNHSNSEHEMLTSDYPPPKVKY